MLCCDRCTRRFSRPSHLERHRLTHLPLSRRNTIPCHHCSQAFSRKDVLLRHMRSTHDIDIQTSNSYQKSCFPCVRRKLKCDRQLPCRSCVASANAESCSFPCTEQASPVERQVVGASRAAVNPLSVLPQQEASGPLGDHQSMTPEQPSEGCHDRVDEPHATRSAFASLDHPSVPGPGLFGGDDPSLLGNPYLAALTQPDLRYGGYDWLDLDISNLDMDFNLVVGADIDLPHPEPDVSTSPASLLLEPPATASVHRHSGLPWPFEQGRENPAPTRLPLPPLREILKASPLSSCGEDASAVEGLVQLLSEPRLPRPDQVRGPSAASGFVLLQRLLDAYFAKFQMIQPIIHGPTFDASDCRTILLASMACIGAVLSESPDSADLAAILSDFCTPMITWFVRPPPSQRPLS